MNKKTILAIIALIAGIAIIVIGSKDVSTYKNFSDCVEGQSVTVSGFLDLNKDINYDPENSPNVFDFYMNDKNGTTKKVIVKQPKPQDFERTESIVVTGKMEGDVFLASEMLLKCPSKYKEDEIRIRAEI